MADDRYIMEFPRDQVAFDQFPGEWTCQPPTQFGIKAGHALAFEDPRLQFMMQHSGGLLNRSVLELGPAEAAHTYFMERAGARDVLAIEANFRCFLKCLVVKNALNLRSKILLGDFMRYLEVCTMRFDFCLCSGVIYHMEDPLKLLHMVSEVSDRVGIWTHYFDAENLKSRPNVMARFPGDTVTQMVGGYTGTYHRHVYPDKGRADFVGGAPPFSFWMPRKDIVGALRHFGFNKIEIADDPNHVNGPCFTLYAER